MNTSQTITPVPGAEIRATYSDGEVIAVDVVDVWDFTDDTGDQP